MARVDPSIGACPLAGGVKLAADPQCRWAAGHPRNLIHTDSKAVTPMSPAAQKFQVLILCSLLDSSVTLSSSSLPGLVPRKRHIAEANQNAAEPHPVIIAAVSMNDFMIAPNHLGQG
jgi:hypothetical protein